MSVIVHITARAGSRGIPNKNLRTVGGISLVGHAVRVGRLALQRLGLAGDVFVDTDGEAIAQEGRRWGAHVPFLRLQALAGDTVTSIDTVLGALDRLAEHGRRYDTLVLLQPTSPLRTVDEVAACFHVAAQSATALTITSPSHPPERTLIIDSQGALHPLFDLHAVALPRQAHAERVTPSGAVYVISTTLLRQERSFLIPGRTRGVRVPVEHAVDVDHVHELHAAERWLESSWRTSRPAPRVAPLTPACVRAEHLAFDAQPQAILAPQEFKAFHHARTLAIGLGVELALELSAADPLWVGFALAHGASWFVAPPEHEASITQLLARANALTLGAIID